uniref:Uncharacterized protein n=1 Tax=Cacopsylla melanoneura TaxID=428564 RepID=A0A8D8YZS2_9HEMI
MTNSKYLHDNVCFFYIIFIKMFKQYCNIIFALHVIVCVVVFKYRKLDNYVILPYYLIVQFCNNCTVCCCRFVNFVFRIITKYPIFVYSILNLYKYITSYTRNTEIKTPNMY